MKKQSEKSSPGAQAEGRVKNLSSGKVELLLDRPALSKDKISAKQTDVFAGNADIPIKKRSYICPYCVGSVPLGMDAAGDQVLIKSDHEKAVIGTDLWSFQIRYCPKCGRDMTRTHS